MPTGEEMAQVEVDQAVFTSSGTGPIQGYQLVARSSGIDERAAHVLRQWSPSHNGLASRNDNATSLNYFPIDKNRIAIGRTVYGLPEYSGRGSLQTVTIYMVTSLQHLADYLGDVWMMASIARSMGLLRFDSKLNARMSTEYLPDSTILAGRPDASANEKIACQPRELLVRGRNVAVAGDINPIATLRQIFWGMNVEQRMATSFATGLSHSIQRRFKLEFFESSDTDLRYELTCNDMSIIQIDNQTQAREIEPIIV